MNLNYVHDNEFSIKNRAEEESENKNEVESKSLKSILDENLNEKLGNETEMKLLFFFIYSSDGT